MRLYRLILSVLLLLIASIFASTIFSYQPDASGISLHIIQSKINYLAGEKTWLKIVLANNSGKDYAHKEFYVLPNGITLKVVDHIGKYLEYNGPVPIYLDTTYILKDKDSLIHYSPVSEFYNLGKGTYTVSTEFQNIVSDKVNLIYNEPYGIDKEIYSKLNEYRKERAPDKLKKLFFENPGSVYAPEIFLSLVNSGDLTKIPYEELHNVFFQNHSNSLYAMYAVGIYKYFMERVRKYNQSEILQHLKNLAASHRETFTEEFINNEYFEK